MIGTGRSTETRWIDVGPQAKAPVRSIATAGLPRSASAQAAEHLWCERGDGPVPSIELHASYDEAAHTLLHGLTSHLLIPNGRSDIVSFYEDTRLRFSSAFVHSTNYVLVSSGEHAASTPQVAIPAGLSAVAAQLLHERFSSFVVQDVLHEGEAVSKVRNGGADLTLLTADAAESCGLPLLEGHHLSQMLWSVFIPSAPMP
ncbi:hypothetical protein [Streptomyces sp. 2A115]|uniref:hypothetical protein n=1 Tax=Streptomyces sp. 2A115 TaxID=3457439 RepID=UPI003FD34F6F